MIIISKGVNVSKKNPILAAVFGTLGVVVFVALVVHELIKLLRLQFGWPSVYNVEITEVSLSTAFVVFSVFGKLALTLKKDRRPDAEPASETYLRMEYRVRLIVVSIFILLFFTT